MDEPSPIPCPFCGDLRTYREEVTTATRCEQCGVMHGVGRMGASWMVIACGAGRKRRSRRKSPPRRGGTEMLIDGKSVKKPK